MNEERRRLVLATLAGMATGAVLILLVTRLALPALRDRLTPVQIDWLRRAFAERPRTVLGVLVAAVAVLGLPILGVFRWVYGPFTARRP